MKKRNQRIVTWLVSIVLAFALVGCSANDNQSNVKENSVEMKEPSSASETEDLSNQIVMGQVVSIEGNSLVLRLMNDNSGEMQGTPPEAPNQNESGTPSEPPTQNESGTPSEPPTQNESGTPSEPPTQNESGTPSEPPTQNEKTITVDIEGVSILAFSETDSSTATEVSVDQLTENTMVRVEFGDDQTVKSITVMPEQMSNPGGQMPGGQAPQGDAPGNGQGFGGSGEVSQGTSVTTVSDDGQYENGTYTSTGDDENALRIDGAKVSLTAVTVDKSEGKSSNTEDGDFYGMNAALLATNGADLTVTDSTISSSAQNGNGVFSYGEGTKVTISDSKITTTADNSGGIQTTGGAEMNAKALTVETFGNSSAAIRSDRGGGTVSVDEGTYTSNGYNSPAVYSTAAISVSNAVLTANHSEALVIEGKNSLTLDQCTVFGNMSKDQGSSSDENVHNIMIYQSMSGDAAQGMASFTMNGGELTSQSGDMIYVTNTEAEIRLQNVTVKNNDADGLLLRITGNSGSHGWGTAGENGASVKVEFADQTIQGDIVVDTASTMNLVLSGDTVYTGSIQIVDNEKAQSQANNAVVTVEEGSTWTLSGDCTLSSLTNEGTIDYNGYTITLADGTVLK